MKKYNSMIGIALVALCLLSGHIHAEKDKEESASFDYKKPGFIERNAAAIGLGAIAVGALGQWGIPKVREWWGGPAYVYNRNVKAAKISFYKFFNLFYNSEPFSIIKEKFSRDVFTSYGPKTNVQTISGKKELKKILEETIKDINGLCIVFDAKHKIINMAVPIVHYTIMGLMFGVFSVSPHFTASALFGASVGTINQFIDRYDSIVGMGEKLKDVQSALKKAIDACKKELKLSIQSDDYSDLKLTLDIKNIDKNIDTNVIQDSQIIFKKDWAKLVGAIDRILLNVESLNAIDDISKLRK